MTVIFAHRGSKINRPENTLSAFLEAIRVGADGIELDVHRSLDNVLVVIHDETVDRTTNGTGLVRGLTLKELKQLDAGSWFSEEFSGEKISTLEEVLDFLNTKGFRGILNIEIKTDKFHYPGIEKDIADLMHKKKYLFDYMYCSFNYESLYLMRKFDPTVELAYLVKNIPLSAWLGTSFDFIGALHPKKSWLFLNISRLSRFNLPFRPWTLNKKKEIEYAFKSHLSGFMTDCPALAVEIKNQLIKSGKI